MDGWIVIDKPKGITSTKVVNRVKYALKLKNKIKIGHAGTLDPMATGMLVIGVGEATKLIEYAQKGRKIYQFTVEFGQSRDTEDAEGKIIAENNFRPNIKKIQNIMSKFLGCLMQVPPAYSALKVDGKRAHALARKGHQVILNPRKIEVFSLQLLETNGDEASINSASFLVECSKGTYVRALARDIASETGCLGYITSLRRLSSGGFKENMMISLEKLEEMIYRCEPFGVHAVDEVLDDILAIQLTLDDLKRVSHGNIVAAAPDIPQGVVQVKNGGKLLALCENASGFLKPVRVFNLGRAV